MELGLGDEMYPLVDSEGLGVKMEIFPLITYSWGLQIISREVGLLIFPRSNSPSLVMYTLSPLTTSCPCQIDVDNS